MTIISTTVGKNPSDKWSSPHSQQESKMQYLGAISKNDRMILIGFQGEPLTIKETQIYAPTSNAKEAEMEQFHEDLQEN